MGSIGLSRLLGLVGQVTDISMISLVSWSEKVSTGSCCLSVISDLLALT